MHYCTSPLLQYCTAVVLHCCTAAILNCCTAALLYCCTAALLHCCTAALLHCCTAALLHCCNAVMPYYCTAVLLHSTLHCPWELNKKVCLVRILSINVEFTYIKQNLTLVFLFKSWTMRYTKQNTTCINLKSVQRTLYFSLYSNLKFNDLKTLSYCVLFVLQSYLKERQWNMSMGRLNLITKVE